MVAKVFLLEFLKKIFMFEFLVCAPLAIRVDAVTNISSSSPGYFLTNSF